MPASFALGRPASMTLCAFAFVLACIVLSACEPLDEDEVDCAELRFDSEAWRSADTSELDTPTSRQRAADGLIECETLSGLDRAEVRRLLGPPASTRRGRAEWITGPERGYGVDFELLEIRFDPSGIVRSVRLSQG